MAEEELEGYEMTEDEKRLKAKESEEEAELARMMNEVTGTNRKIDDDYDEKMKRLNDKRKARPETSEDMNNTLSSLKERVTEMKSAISEARREGKDPFIADLKLRNINAKIRIAELSGDLEDVAKIELILKDVEYELGETMKEEEVNVKKEIEERLKAELAKGKEKKDEGNVEA